MMNGMVSKVRVGYEIFTDFAELADYIGESQARALLHVAVGDQEFQVYGAYRDYVELPGVAPEERFATVYAA